MNRSEQIQQFTESIQQGLIESKSDMLSGLIREIAELKYQQQELSKQIEVYQRALSQRDALLPTLETDSANLSFPATKILIDAMYPLGKAEGFFDVEFDGQGRPYRWTGPGTSFQFSIFIPNTQAYTGKLSLFGSLKSENLKKICVYVNGIKQESHIDVSKDFALEFTIAKRSTIGTVSIVFMIPETAIPNDVQPGAQDARRLGVAFHALELVALESR
ncbi:MAG: hypothetical protein KDD62_02440 [Bdellovibrionales bacterium]|nr:hypothetical protein [Bdellovibrionales bacterium]